MKTETITPGDRVNVDHRKYNLGLWPGTVVSVKSDLKGRETLVRHDNGKVVSYRTTPIVKIKK